MRWYLLQRFSRYFSFLACIFTINSSHAQASFEMRLFGPADGTHQVIGGVPANGSDWPSTFYFGSAGRGCTSTAVGPQVVITAAHCVADGESGTVYTPSQSISARCDHHTDYAADFEYDIALCLTDEIIILPDDDGEKSLFETLNLSPAVPRIGDPVILLGFGCRQEGGGGSSGALYIGSSELKGFSGIYLRTEGGAAVCFGDSGGAGYANLSSVSRRIIGINSRGDISTKSYLTPIAIPGVLDFILKWTEQENVVICGVSENVSNCQP